MEKLVFEKNIQAKPELVWDILTNPIHIRRWMGGADLQLEVISDWEEGSDIVFKGFHHVQFEAAGKIIELKPFSKFCYTHLSSISRLPETEQNFTWLDFTLKELKNSTQLSLEIRNFPTETIFKHLQFYWKTTLQIIKIETENMASVEIY